MVIWILQHSLQRESDAHNPSYWVVSCFSHRKKKKGRRKGKKILVKNRRGLKYHCYDKCHLSISCFQSHTSSKVLERNRTNAGYRGADQQKLTHTIREAEKSTVLSVSQRTRTADNVCPGLCVEVWGWKRSCPRYSVCWNVSSLSRDKFTFFYLFILFEF